MYESEFSIKHEPIVHMKPDLTERTTQNETVNTPINITNRNARILEILIILIFFFYILYVLKTHYRHLVEFIEQRQN